MPMTQNIEPGKAAEPGQPVERLVPNPKAKLRDQFHEVCRFKRMAERFKVSAALFIDRPA